MYFIIDYDTRQVETAHEDKSILDKYISDNDLELAVALISSEEELYLQFSLRELTDLCTNLSGFNRTFMTEKQAAKDTWDVLEDDAHNVPTFTKTVGRRLLKAAAKRNKDSYEGPITKCKIMKDISKKLRLTTEAIKTKPIIHGSKTPKEGSRPRKYYDFIEDNFGEASLEGLVEEFDLELDESEIIKELKYSIQYQYLNLGE